jgi:hypothetical protein
MTNIKTKTLDEMSSNKFNFKLHANKSFSQFSNVYARQVIVEVYEQIKVILHADFQTEDIRCEAIVNDLKSRRAIDMSYKADLLYDTVKMKQKVKPVLTMTIQKLDMNDAFVKLEESLQTWMPNSKNFSRNFVEFSMSKFTSLSTIKSISVSKEFFFSNQNQVLLRYASEKKSIFQQDVYEQVKALLEGFNKWYPSRVEDDMEILRSNSIENKFTPQMLSDVNELSLLLESVLIGRLSNVLSFHTRCK